MKIRLFMVLSFAILIMTILVSNNSNSSLTSIKNNSAIPIFDYLPTYYNYVDQYIPFYIDGDFSHPYNPINDTIATLGRVLFYDKNLSVPQNTSCGSCHKQAFAFGDTSLLSQGHMGELTERHSMRLVNLRFGQTEKFFWDERVTTLEAQTTDPIKDHLEMGFSGVDGDPNFNDLLDRLNGIDYYDNLFLNAFGDSLITEERIQLALAQFVRSIQSFDSKYDQGRVQVESDKDPFPNFTDQENIGKTLFIIPQNVDGAHCHSCHVAPVFDIDPLSDNNGVIGVAKDPNAIDLSNTRSPSLRDLVNPTGTLNGPLMHDGSFKNLMEVIDHYNEMKIDPRNKDLLDPRLKEDFGIDGQRIELTQNEKEALLAFLKTLTGYNVYTDKRWSDPFDANGMLVLE